MSVAPKSEWRKDAGNAERRTLNAEAERREALFAEDGTLRRAKRISHIRAPVSGWRGRGCFAFAQVRVPAKLNMLNFAEFHACFGAEGTPFVKASPSACCIYSGPPFHAAACKWEIG